jgi:hypothetical protein
MAAESPANAPAVDIASALGAANLATEAHKAAAALAGAPRCLPAGPRFGHLRPLPQLWPGRLDLLFRLRGALRLCGRRRPGPVLLAFLPACHGRRRFVRQIRRASRDLWLLR